MKKKLSLIQRYFLIITLCISATSLAKAQSATYQPPVFINDDRLQKIEAAFPTIEKIYKEYAEKHQFPGFIFGVVVDGKLVHSGSYGYNDVDKKLPVTTQSVFRIASMTKSFTAMAILQLRDAGKLRLDDPAHQYIPELKKVAYLTTDAPPITIRHLMTHAAGFPEDNPWGDRQLADTDEELLQLVAQGISFSNVPGVAYEYSNLGFSLLGQIVSRVSGESYQQYIKENILQLLGMEDTYWEYANVPADQLAHGYRLTDRKWEEVPLLHDGSFGAMGGMLTSMDDFVQYIALHLLAWPPRDGEAHAVLQKSSLREMHQPQRISYFNPKYKYPNGKECAVVAGYYAGLGWVQDCESRVRVGHTGGLPGFGSNWLILPEYGVGLVCFANLTYAPTSTVNLQVMDTLFALASLQPRQLPVSPVLKQRKEELAALLPDWEKAQASGLFAENFFLDNRLEELEKETNAAFGKAGKIIKIHDLKPENQLRGTFVMEGEKGKLQVNFTLTPEKVPLIQYFDISEVQ